MVNNEQPSSEELMRRVRDDDCHDSLEILIQRHEPSDEIYSASLLNMSEAQEAVQEKNIRLWDYRHTYKDGVRFSPWNRAILRNCCWSILKKRKPTVSLSVGTTQDPQEPEIGNRPEKAKLSRAIRECLALLSEKLQNVAILRLIYELDETATAEELEIAVGTVKSRLSNARKALQPCLSQKLGYQHG